MSKSELFSDDVVRVLDKHLFPKFGFYCKLYKTNNNTVLYIGFLPIDFKKELEGKISNDDIESISRIYKLFSDHYLDKLSIKALFSQRFGNKVKRRNCEEFTNMTNMRIKLYESENRIKLVELFEACLGLRDKGMLPRYLQSEIFGTVK